MNYQSNRVSVLVVFCLGITILSGCLPAPPLNLTLNVKEIIRRTTPSVVTVLSYDNGGKLLGLGSGFIARSDGLVVSNYHVIKRAQRVFIKMEDGDSYEVAGVIDIDSQRDFVILKISGYDLPAVPFGNSNTVEIGDKVIAIGNPRGLEHTVSDGMISQSRQTNGYTLLQITAPISQGSSGGPVLNARGEVIGITTSTILEGQNLNFALPSNYIRGALENGTAIKYAISDLARWQAKQDETELMQVFASIFNMYEDPDHLFKMVYPSGWKVERTAGWDDTGTIYSKYIMFAPKDAHRAEVNGYISEGIRLHFQFPPKGKVWPKSSVSTWWGPDFMKSMLRSNPGFVATESAEVKFGGQTARIYSFVGQNNNIPEPEKTTMILLSNPHYRLSIDLISPASKLESYDKIYPALMKNFELSPRLANR